MEKRQRLWILTAGGFIFLAAVVAVLLHSSQQSANTSGSSSPGNSSLPPSVTHPMQTQSKTPKVESQSSTLVSGSATSIVTVRSSATLGKYLADVNGRALYTYNIDLPDQSNCSGSCAKAWPPYTTVSIPHMPVNVSDVKRADGRIQYTHKGLPLYYFANEKSGVVTGNGVGGFTVAKP